MDLHLDADESAVLRKALTSYLSELRMEIVDTDNPGYRRDLRDERTLLEGIVERMSAAAATAATQNGSTETVVRISMIWTG